MPKLICLDGPGAGREFPLVKDITSLGQLASCDVQVPDALAAPVQVQIRRHGRLFTCVDLNAKQASGVNGFSAAERLLLPGDQVLIGETRFAVASDGDEPSLATLIPGYRIDGRVGEGAMGVVFRAHHPASGRTVALKILSPRYANRPRFIEQFEREARAALTLDHPNIIRVYDAGAVEGVRYFAMELVVGRTAQDELAERGPLPVGEALELARQTAEGLAHLHAHRLLHRDIKPGNLLLTAHDGRMVVKIVDFGVAASLDGPRADDISAGNNAVGSNSSGMHRVAGTPHYLAPEVGAGLPFDHRSDLYSLGATLWHLLTGAPPFTGRSPVELVAAHIHQPLPALKKLRPELRTAIVKLVERLLEKDPVMRFPDARATADALARYVDGEVPMHERSGGHARPATEPVRRATERQQRRRGLRVALLFIGAVTVGLALWWLLAGPR